MEFVIEFLWIHHIIHLSKQTVSSTYSRWWRYGFCKPFECFQYSQIHRRFWLPGQWTPFRGSAVAFGEDAIRMYTWEGVWWITGQVPVSLQEMRCSENSVRGELCGNICLPVKTGGWWQKTVRIFFPWSFLLGNQRSGLLGYKFFFFLLTLWFWVRAHNCNWQVTRVTLDLGSASFFCKASDDNVMPCRSHGLCHKFNSATTVQKHSLDDVWVKGLSCVPVKLYL